MIHKYMSKCSKAEGDVALVNSISNFRSMTVAFLPQLCTIAISSHLLNSYRSGATFM